jgi:diguanylate cyclase (GGDEF)-like protein
MAGSTPTAGALVQAGVALPAPPSARRFPPFVAATVSVAIAVVVLLLPGSPPVPVGDAAFWMLAAGVLAGELLPIKLPRRDDLEEIALSTPFAFALMLAAGPLPAVAVYALASVVHDVVDGRAPLKTVFNAAQYSLSLLAGAAVLALGGAAAPTPGLLDGHLPLVLAAGVAIFIANQVFVGTGTALVTGGRIRDLVLGDLPFQSWTGGFLLTLAPLALAAAERHAALLPLIFFPMLAIRIGGGQAILNAHRAWHDDLTDLPNRRLLHQRLADATEEAERQDGSVVVAILDLNGFKAVNDTLGHEQGDHLLCDVGARLAATVPEDATFARLGGDEFGVVIPGATLVEGRMAMLALMAELEEPFELEGLSVQVDAAAGLAAFPQHGSAAEDLLRRADVALYSAKSGGTEVEAYAAEDDEHSLDRLALAGQLRRGLARGELIVHFQPKVAVVPGRRHGVEALVRWNHPQLGLIGPDGFIPLAEQSSLLKPLTQHVLEVSLRQCRAWRDEGHDLRVSVNLSARSLLDRDLPHDVARLLRASELPGDVLQLEITESRLVSDFRRAEYVLAALRELGVGLAIDDFGTGFSSLAQLQRLPVDEIKIDKSFVLNMATNADDAAIVRSTIELGRTLALDVTAEGVETPEAYAHLVALGCHFAQGYHVGRPSPAASCQRDLQRFVRDEEAAAHA